MFACRFATALLLTAFLSACATQSGSQRQAKIAVADALPPQRGLTFRNLQNYPGRVVCGEWQGKSPDGEYRYHLPFVAVDGRADPEPRAEDVAFYCNEDPARWLQDTAGIGPVTRDNAILGQIIEDLETVGAALQAYGERYFNLPSTAQGLQPLLTPGPSRRTGDTPEPFLDRLPADPWGQPYRYENDSLGGVEETFQLYTLGADQRRGGAGDDTDVTHSQLPYIHHVLSIK